jgi:hypothetical protein
MSLPFSRKKSGLKSMNLFFGKLMVLDKYKTVLFLEVLLHCVPIRRREREKTHFPFCVENDRNPGRQI